MTDFICRKCGHLELDHAVSDPRQVPHQSRPGNCDGLLIEAVEALAFCESTNADALRAHIATLSAMRQRLSNQLQASNFSAVAAGTSPGQIDIGQIRERTNQDPSNWIARTFRLDEELANRLTAIMENASVSIAAAYTIDFHEHRAARQQRLRDVNETVAKVQSRLRLWNRLDRASSNYLQVMALRDAKPENNQCLTLHSNHYTSYQLRAIEQLRGYFEDSDNTETCVRCVNCESEVEISAIDSDSMTPHIARNVRCGFSGKTLTNCDRGTLIMGAKQYEYLINDENSPEAIEAASSS